MDAQFSIRLSLDNLDLERLRQALASEVTILFAYLCSSSASGETTPLSDVDIAVLPVKKLSIDDRLGLIQRLGKKTKLENVGVTFLDRLDNLYLLNSIIKQGILLLDRDRDHRELFWSDGASSFSRFSISTKTLTGCLRGPGALTP